MRQTLLVPLFTSAVLWLGGCDKDQPASATPGKAHGYTISAATYRDDAKVSELAKGKCKFEIELTETVTTTLQEKGVGGKNGEGHTVTLVIAHVHGAEEDWDGEIRVMVEGRLELPDESFHDFVAHGNSTAHVGRGKAGVCDGLEDIAAEISEDIVEWLKEPRHEAELGDHPT
ncbi:MAG: hypothetical protein K1X88_20080 [Nannocystaceae bacterium]|nr:hypothetical protein [Nannocystaceae bacterium]